MKYPHFDFYPASWTGDGNNGYLSYEEKGIHMELLCAMWQDAAEDRFGLLDNDQGIAKMLGLTIRKWRKVRSVLVDGPYAVLLAKDGVIWSERLYEEWQKARGRSASARKSRSQRTSNERTTNVLPTNHDNPTNVERSSDDRTYEPPTSKQLPVSNKDTTTTARVRDAVMTQAEAWILDQLAKTQLDAVEWTHLEEALHHVHQDLPRFQQVVQQKLAKARDQHKTVQSFNYFINAFRDLAAQAANTGSTPRASPYETLDEAERKGRLAH